MSQPVYESKESVFERMAVTVVRSVPRKEKRRAAEDSRTPQDDIQSSAPKDQGTAFTVNAFMQKFAVWLKLAFARTAQSGLTNV